MALNGVRNGLKYSGPRSGKLCVHCAFSPISALFRTHLNVFHQAADALEMYDGPDALALMHKVESSIDVFQRHCIANELVDFDFAIHVLLNHSR